MLGLAVVGVFTLYLLSDLLEVLGGGFSTGQLLLTFAVEAAIPFVVVGLCMAQKPPIGTLGQAGALAFGYSYVFFAFTALYALVAQMPNFHVLSEQFGLLFIANGALMVTGGLAFAIASLRAEVFPPWTARALMGGVVLVAATQAAPDVVRLVPALLRDIGFVGMGVVLLRGRLAAQSGERALAMRGVSAAIPPTTAAVTGTLERRTEDANRRAPKAKGLAAAKKPSRLRRGVAPPAPGREPYGRGGRQSIRPRRAPAGRSPGNR